MRHLWLITHHKLFTLLRRFIIHHRLFIHTVHDIIAITADMVGETNMVEVVGRSKTFEIEYDFD